GLRIHSDDRVAKEILAATIGTPAIEGRRGNRQVDDAAFLIANDRGPDIHARTLFPAVAFPAPKANFPRLWNGVKAPQLPAGTDIKSPDVAGRAQGGGLLHPAPGNDNVP